MTKKRIKTTRSDRRLRRYYSRRSVLSLKTKIRKVAMSFPKPRKLVALRIDEETLEGLRRIAAKKGLNYSTLMRMWITERLREETL